VQKQNIAIAANFTIEPIEETLEFFLKELRIANQITFAPYNQIFQELINPNSIFQSNKDGVNLLFVRIEDFIDQKSIGFKPSEKDFKTIIENAADFLLKVDRAENFQVPMFIFICPPSKGLLDDKTTNETISKIEESFLQQFKNYSNIFSFSGNKILNDYKISEYDNPKANLLGHIPYTDEFFAGLGAFTARKISALIREPYKVIVLDCDQTLWKGVCGEDGTYGIKFEEPWLALQRFMSAQSDTGMLLCLCSKNNEEAVWEVFDQRPEMILKREQIVSSKINWEFKSGNIKAIAEELNLGLNSFIFVDDDPVVCAEVQANCPEILTLNLPENPGGFENFLNNVWAFDKLKITKEDRLRADSYKQQIKRQQIQQNSNDWNEFLEDLQLVCEISKMNSEQLPRVSQLSLRTNQFNSTTLRRSESEVNNYLSTDKNHIWVVNIRDRFGDYGLVGSIFFSEKKESLEVDSFMLSCRALGRGVEHKMVSALGEKALKLGLKSVNIKFTPTEKNTPIFKFLTENGGNHKIEKEDEIFFKFPAEKASKLNFGLNFKRADQGKQNKKNQAFQKNTDDFTQIYNQAILKIATQICSADNVLREISKTKNEPSRLNDDYVKPENQTEKRLIEIWEKVLNMKKIGITDNFFTIGGDSLSAVSLFVDIENEFGKSLPLSTLINAPTIEAIAEILDNKNSENKWKYLVPIQTKGKHSPLFCMHAAGGNVLFYRDLAKELGSDQPVFGLQARGIADKSETAHESVEEMAKEYINEIKLVQFEGPYKLCGSSFGGLVAFETACQLLAEGESVELLALFDTYAPGYPKIKPNRFPFEQTIRRTIEKAKSVKKQINSIKGSYRKIDFIKGKLNKIYIGSKRKLLWKRNEFAVKYNKTSGRELPVDLQRNHKAIQKALINYQPAQYTETLTIFRAAEQPSEAVFDPTLGWKDFTIKEIELEEVPGSHGALTVYPFAAYLAKSLTPYLYKQPAKADNQIEKIIGLGFSA
jgi:FkbH-like protein